MNVRIVYCEVCHYHDRAHALADELRERFGATVEVVEGKFGQFDVIVDGEVIASRGASFLARMLPRDAPASEAVIAAIARAVEPREGDACEVPRR